MELEYFTLSNGIRVVHKKVDGNVAHCGIVINAGSREEGQDEQGLAHYIEHTLFKGTHRRKAYHILSRLEDVGGELNAYTSKEETFIYASFLKDDYHRAIELIADITLNATFPEREIQKEKEVIKEEINSFLDSPSDMIFDDFEDQIFKGNSIGRNILGTADSLKGLGRKHILDFQSKWYTTDEMVISSVGNFSGKKLATLLEKYFGNKPQSSRVNHRQQLTDYVPQEVISKKDTYQTHAIIGNRAYDANHKYNTGLVLLNNIMGGPGSSSRLNLNIREKYGFAYHIESFYTPYSDTGSFGIYVGTDPGTVSKSLKLIHKELEKVRTKKMGVLQLSKAKKQLKGQIALSHESRSNQMMAFGKSKLLFDKIDSLEEVYQKIEAVTPEMILDIANDIFDPNRLTTLIYKAK